ncbi:MAG TPA: T9SS type A sorting domain-containing protein [Saprospiraceae bacterium]|nr:T9SS type A sorting domain-containing protein [Saprospiraceae bacterium]
MFTLPTWNVGYVLQGVSANIPNLDFIGVKTGDINQTCTDCGGLQMRSDNTTAPSAFSASFRISTPTAPVHSEVLVPVYAQTPLEVGAMNIDWTFNAGRFVLQDIVWAGLRANEISTVVIESNRLRMIWGAMKPFEVVNADEPLFYLKGYVVKQTALGGAFVEMIPGDETNVVIDDYLRLRPIQIAENTDFEVSVFPNPFGQSTSFLLDLPDSGSLDIRIFSADGRLLDTHRLYLPAGLHTWHWPGADQAPAGLLLYQIDSPSGRRSGKLLKSK